MKEKTITVDSYDYAITAGGDIHPDNCNGMRIDDPVTADEAARVLQVVEAVAKVLPKTLAGYRVDSISPSGTIVIGGGREIPLKAVRRIAELSLRRARTGK